MRKTISLKGQRFGKWKVRKRAEDVCYGKIIHKYWICECDCGTISTISAGSLRSGLSTRCRTCAARACSEHHKGKRFRKDGVTAAIGTTHTQEDKRNQYNKQNGLCGLCDKPLPIDIEKCHWDHDHSTGKLRAVVHSKCNNQIIALVENHPELIEKAKDYLQSWK